MIETPIRNDTLFEKNIEPTPLSLYGVEVEVEPYLSGAAGDPDGIESFVCRGSAPYIDKIGDLPLPLNYGEGIGLNRSIGRTIEYTPLSLVD